MSISATGKKVEPAGVKSGGLFPGVTSSPEIPDGEQIAVVSIRFPSGLVYHYKADGFEETPNSYVLFRNGEHAQQTIATVHKVGGFIIDAEFPISIENGFSQAEKESGMFERGQILTSTDEVEKPGLISAFFLFLRMYFARPRIVQSGNVVTGDNAGGDIVKRK